MRFYIGLHKPWQASHFARACLSVRSLRTRRKPIDCPAILLDSGAFTELHLYGGYRQPEAAYATEIRRLAGLISIEAAVAQDYMCEPFMLKRTGLTVAEHQALTIDRYDRLAACQLPCPVMPVLQGYQPADYVRHLAAYGDRLAEGMWVGVGSVCKRNANPNAILDVLHAIAWRRPDIRLHGFGIKRTALEHDGVRALLASANSMAWSYAARREGRNGNAHGEALAYAALIERQLGKPLAAWQPPLPF